ncbi:MAG: RidA family protein [Rhizobiales bacterium]|nr:RidA family protein [Hyphomicrobiales bacterium]
MSIRRIESGTHLSKVVIHGDTVYLAGMTANKTLGKSVTEQTREILSMIDGYLAQAGTDKSKLLKTNIWLTDIATWAEMNAVWNAWIVPGNPPARATVEAKLANAAAKVEIMVEAAK